MGKFIAIDGLDGSGKHTQFELLCEYLSSRGLRVRKLVFPVYESDSSIFVRMYLDGRLGSTASDTNAYAASMFFAADRYVSFVTDWRRDYEDPGTVIVADRYTTANAIHQLSKLPRESWDGFISWLTDFEFQKLGVPAPDLVLFLELPPEVSIMMVERRAAETGQKLDIHERDHDFVFRSHEAGLYASDVLGWQTLHCADSAGTSMRTREDIFADIKAHVDLTLGL